MTRLAVETPFAVYPFINGRNVVVRFHSYSQRGREGSKAVLFQTLFGSTGVVGFYVRPVFPFSPCRALTRIGFVLRHKGFRVMA
jgi:hypothetical protein